MNYKKFKPELSDQELDDIEKGTTSTKSEASHTTEETKSAGGSRIKVMMLTGETKEME